MHGRAAHAERGELVPGELGGAEVDEVGDDGGDAGGRWMSAIEGGREVREREARVEKGERTP